MKSLALNKSDVVVTPRAVARKRTSVVQPNSTPRKDKNATKIFKIPSVPQVRESSSAVDDPRLDIAEKVPENIVLEHNYVVIEEEKVCEDQTLQVDHQNVEEVTQNEVETLEKEIEQNENESEQQELPTNQNDPSTKKIEQHEKETRRDESPNEQKKLPTEQQDLPTFETSNKETKLNELETIQTQEEKCEVPIEIETEQLEIGTCEIELHKDEIIENIPQPNEVETQQSEIEKVQTVVPQEEGSSNEILEPVKKQFFLKVRRFSGDKLSAKSEPIKEPESNLVISVPESSQSNVIPTRISNPVNFIQVKSINSSPLVPVVEAPPAKVTTPKSTDVLKTKELRPWLRVDDFKQSQFIESMKKIECLSNLYKCMFSNCDYNSDSQEFFREHCRGHRGFMKCSYCSFSEKQDVLVSHISKCHKISPYACNCCFYRANHKFLVHQHLIKYHSTETMSILCLSTGENRKEFDVLAAKNNRFKFVKPCTCPCEFLKARTLCSEFFGICESCV